MSRFWFASWIGTVLLVLWLMLVTTACSRPPAPQKPKQAAPAIEADLVCFVLESLLGFGMVCAERPGPCKFIQQKTAEADGVSAISECKKARVVVEAQ